MDKSGFVPPTANSPGSETHSLGATVSHCVAPEGSWAVDLVAPLLTARTSRGKNGTGTRAVAMLSTARSTQTDYGVSDGGQGTVVDKSRGP